MPESMYEHRGRSYRVVARFDGADRVAMANAYIERHTHVGVLTDTGEEVIIASDTDKGVAVLDAVDSEFGTKGWTQLLKMKA